MVEGCYSKSVAVLWI